MRPNLFLRLGDYLFVLRPLILIPAWSFFLLGIAHASGAGPALHIPPGALSPLLSLTGILVTAYLINQIFDRESDARNGKIFYLARGIFTERTLLILAAVFFVIASASFQRVGDGQRLPLLLALLLSLTYSLPPVRLCARPFLDLVANAVGYGGVAFILGFSLVDPSLNVAFRQSIPYVLLVGATFLHTTILDIEGDRETGKISTAVFIGARKSAITALILVGAALLLSLWTRNYAAAIVCGASLPAAAYAAVRVGERPSSLQVQTATLAVTIAAAVALPRYLYVVVPLIVLSRFYYRYRFGISYPGA